MIAELPANAVPICSQPCIECGRVARNRWPIPEALAKHSIDVLQTQPTTIRGLREVRHEKNKPNSLVEIAVRDMEGDSPLWVEEGVMRVCPARGSGSRLD
jgi:hypothetical protein